MKRLISIVCVIAMVFSLLIMPVEAATKVDASYEVGEYEGSATGYDDGTVTVKVTISKDSEGNTIINDLVATGEKQTKTYWENALAVVDDIKKNNGTENVDTVSGATMSSRAIIEATDAALLKALGENIFDGGIGTKSKPYLVKSADTLQKFSKKVAEGTTYEGKYIALSDNIDLKGVEWTPIGTDKANPFSGNFDGKNKTISNLTIKGDATYTGFFGYVKTGTTISNLNLEQVDITTTGTYAGAVAAYMENDGKSDLSTVVNNCHASGSITVTTTNKTAMVGGLIGMSNQRAAITSSGSSVAVNVNTGTGIGNVGGLIGMASIKALVMNDYNLGDVTLTSTNANANVGGIAGTISGIVYNNYVSGNVSGVKNAGGIAGSVAAAAYLTSCYYTQDVAYGKSTGKIDEQTVVQKSDVKTKEFATVLSNGLSKASLNEATTKVLAAAIADCTDFNALLSRVNSKFYDWTVEKDTVTHSDSIWANSVIEDGIFASGKGTKEDPYILLTEDQIRDFAVSLTSKLDYSDTYIELGNDITLTKEWMPIGEGEYGFNGHFDGNNHTVKGLFIGSKEAPYEDGTGENARVFFGFFGVLEKDAEVSNLNLDVAIYARGPQTIYVGGLFGYAEGALIDSVNVSGTVEGYTTHSAANIYVGGLAGNGLRQRIINSSSSANVRSEAVGGVAEAGGIVGLQNRGIIANCYTTGKITGSADRKAEGAPSLGGIAGVHAGTIVNCYSKADIIADCFTGYVGAMAGWATGIADTFQCYFSSDMTIVTDDKTADRVEISPAVGIGWGVGPGINDEGEPYTGSVSLDVVALSPTEMTNGTLISTLNSNISKLKVDLVNGGRQTNHWKGSETLATSLKEWNTDGTLSAKTKKATYDTNTADEIEALLPEKNVTYAPGDFYGRDADKQIMVKVTITEEGSVSVITIVEGKYSSLAFKSALEVALDKAEKGDYSTYGKATNDIFESGDGSKENPWVIANEEQLRNFASFVNEDENYSGKYIKLKSDITLTKEWAPAGGVTPNAFSGTFDGQNYTISNLKVGSSKNPYTGKFAALFSCIKNGTVKNLKLKNVDITIENTGSGRIYAGGLAASMEPGSVDSVEVSGKISIHSNSGAAYAGGILGQTVKGTLTNSSADVEINAISDAAWVYAGGLVGIPGRSATINSTAKGSITTKGPVNKVAVGGLFGFHSGVTYNCYADVALTPQSSTGDVGGVAGRNTGIGMMLNSYYKGSGADVAVGSIVVGESGGKGVVEGLEKKDDVTSQEFATLLNNNQNNTEALNRVYSLLKDSWEYEVTPIALVNWKTNGKNNVSLNLGVGKKNIASVKVTVKDVTYNKKAQTPVTIAGLTLNKDYKVTYKNNVNVGKATATITGIGNYEGTKIVTFNIKKASSSVTLKAKTATYTGKNIAIGKATVKGSNGKVTYTYYSNSKCTKKITPKNVGTYYVKATVAANANYNGATSKAVKLTIKKASATIKTKTTSKTVKVSAVKKASQSFSIGASTNSKGKVTYKKSSGSKYITVSSSGKVTIKKGTKKGTYTAKVKVSSKATSNYKAASKTVTVKVKVK